MLLGTQAVISDAAALGAYERDASNLEPQRPALVAVPRSVRDVAAIVQHCRAAAAPIIARGAGTGIAGGTIPPAHGVVLSLARLEQIELIDVPNRMAWVEVGVVNLELSQALAPYGYHFAPDPSSQRAATLGGNIGNNAGGPHCLKYGVTTNHILALEVVLYDGTTLWTGDGAAETTGYDLTGLFVGSEGTFGVATRALVRLTRLPEATRVALALFPDIVSAGTAVSQIIAAGYLPTSLEMMDTYAIRAVNQAYGLGLPDHAGAALIVEVDGVIDGLDAAMDEVIAICRTNQAFDIRPARTAEEQVRVWTARKAVAGAIGRLAPAYYLVDTVVPRTRLPLMMEHVARLGREYELAVLNVFHAGDGNLHPLVLYNPRTPGEKQRAVALAEEVMRRSIAEGGVISGEHGIGAEKNNYLPLMFSDVDLQTMAALYAVFNPENLLNPGKIFPDACPPLDLAAQRRQRIVKQHKTTAPETLPDQIQQILGSTRQWQKKTAPECLRPATCQQLTALVRACHAVGRSIHPLPTPAGVWVSTERMQRVMHYEPNDLTIKVEAGMTLAKLQQTLAEHGQMFPLDAPHPKRTTIGQIVDRALDGPRRLGYGSLRDLLLGVTVVEADGTLVSLGGQVVKNVSGYDLVKLYIGSHTTLGIVAAVSLKVFAMPRSAGTTVWQLPERGRLDPLLTALRASYLTPTAVEYLEGWQCSPDLRGMCMVLCYEGAAAVVERHRRELAEIGCAEGCGVVEYTGKAHEQTWQRINDLAGTHGLAANEALLRISVLPAQLNDLLDDIAAQVGAWQLSARAMNGVAYLRLSGEPATLDALQRHLATRWHHSHVLAGPAALLSSDLRWGALPTTLGLQQAIKAALDPCDTLAGG
jgi:D-lactate dehydrogenase (cytochrome)